MKKLIILPLLAFYLYACTPQEKDAEASYTAFVGATIIDGTGDEPLLDGILLLQNKKIVAVGTREDIAIPDQAVVVNISGKTIIPGLINGHGHVGEVKGIEGGHYSTDNLLENLSIYARYGVTTVVSLGGDKEEAVPLRQVNASFPGSRARLYIAGKVITGDTPDEAMEDIRNNHDMGVDFMKIRVDDNLGTSDKMPEEVYRAVIERSHELGYQIATHMYGLEDARNLLKAGSDLLAHSIRDQPVDDAFIRLIKEKGVGYCPTLTRELSTFVYGDTASFFSDPFFLKEYDAAVFEPLKDPSRQEQVRDSRSAQIYKAQLPTAYANLKTLSDQGIPIIFGTDSGVPTRFMGYFEHLEMEMMAEAGMSPMEIIVSATKNVAEHLRLKGLGTLSEGNWADFLVLDADPLMDIRNCRKISRVFIGGKEVEE